MKNEITDAVVEAAQEMVFGDKRQYLTGDHRNMRAARQCAEAARVVDEADLIGGLEMQVRHYQRGRDTAIVQRDSIYAQWVATLKDLADVKALLAASPAAPVPAEGEGWPREVVSRKFICDGCPDLKTKEWEFEGENDDHD